jgi:GAF domain-containing protein
VAAWLALTGRYALSTRDMPVGNLATWLSGIGTIVLLDAVIVIGFRLLQREFVRAEQQAAASLADLEQERRHLEERVEARTSESLHKTAQLEAASTVSRRIAQVRDLDSLLADVVKAVAEHFQLLHAGIFLVDEESRYAVLQASSSEAGRALIESGFRLKVGPGSLVGNVVEQGRPKTAGVAPAGTGTLGIPGMASARLEMALPLVAREQVIGALDLHSTGSQAFAISDMEIMQSLADQLATAVENARLFSEREAMIAQFRSLIAVQSPDAWRSFLRGRHPVYQYTSTGLRPVAASAMNGDAKTLLVPLAVRGYEIGSIHLRRKQGGPGWSPREEEMAREIAAQVALALDNARLFEETNRRAGLDRLTSDISARISSSTLYESIMQTAAEELSRALGGTEVLVQIQPAGSPAVSEISAPAVSERDRHE